MGIFIHLRICMCRNCPQKFSTYLLGRREKYDLIFHTRKQAVTHVEGKIRALVTEHI